MPAQVDGGFTVSPAIQNAAINTDLTYTIALTGGPAGAGGQVFALADAVAGTGTFNPVGTVTIASGSSSVTFKYQNSAAGNYILTVTPSGGALGGSSAVTAQAVIGATGAPTAFNIKPVSQSTRRGVVSNQFYISLTAAGGGPAVAGGGGQAFTLTTNDTGGTFLPGTTVTVPSGLTSVAFTYQSGNIGTWTITATASGAPYSVNTQTALDVVYGGAPLGAVINPSDVVWDTGYIYSSRNDTFDQPFGKLQNLNFDDSFAKKKLMGPEALIALGVGLSERSLTFDFEFQQVRIGQFLSARGGTRTLVASVADPASAPILTGVASGGSMTITGSAVEVAAAYAHRTKYGTSKISPIGLTTTTVALTAGASRKVTISTVSLPTNVLSLDWFCTSAGYVAGTAASQTLYWIANNGGVSFDILTFPSTTAHGIPSFSEVGQTMTVWTPAINDEPAAFNMKFLSNATGAQYQMLLYNVIVDKLAGAFPLRDFAKMKCNGEAFGDGTKIYDILLPADQSTG